MSKRPKRERLHLRVFGIETPYQFWDEVAAPSYVAFANHPAAKEAFATCLCLWHIIDWIEHDADLNPSKLNIGEIRNRVELACPALSVLHDLITLGKHAGITDRRGHVTGTTQEILGATFSCGPLGWRSDHPADYKIQLADGSEHALDHLFRSATAFWHDFFSTQRNVDSLPAQRPA